MNVKITPRVNRRLADREMKGGFGGSLLVVCHLYHRADELTMT
jgi:hypothetical protein